MTVSNNIYITGALRSARETLGWTRKELADILSVSSGKEISESMVNHWERGDRPVTPDIALEISRNVQVELKDLIERR